jgi:hypothetical protein
MTISNTYVFNDFRDDVIKDALGLIGVTASEEAVDPADIETAARFLNRLLKFLSTKGLHIWRRDQAYLIPQYQQYKYNIGTGGDVAVSSYVSSTLSSNQIISDTVINITSTTGMNNSDKILIELNNNSLYSGTILSHTATTATVTPALTVAATSGGVVYTYATANIIVRPLKILAARRRIAGTDQIDVPMIELSYENYFDLPFKNNDSSFPTEFMYQPNRENLGNLYLWPAPTDVSVVFPFTYEITLADITSANQTMDVPSEWLLAIVYNLAVVLAPMWGKDSRLQAIAPMAGYYLEECLNWDAETVSVSIEPNNWQTQTS